MDNWLTIAEGKYLAHQALLVAPDNTAVELLDTIIHIYTGRNGRRQLQGQGFIYNLLLISLLEEHDELNLLLDMGAEFKFKLIEPALSGGKVFAPNVKSALTFVPTRPWQRLDEDTYHSLVSGISLVAS